MRDYNLYRPVLRENRYHVSYGYHTYHTILQTLLAEKVFKKNVAWDNRMATQHLPRDLVRLSSE